MGFGISAAAYTDNELHFYSYVAKDIYEFEGSNSLFVGVAAHSVHSSTLRDARK